MAEAFPRRLSLLRKERGESQRCAAQALDISQALLSHYENGMREPGYDFLIRAAEYYGVTSDYLLGLSPCRAKREAAPEPGAADEPAKLGLLTGSLRMIYDLLEKLSDEELTGPVERYLTLGEYKIFRYLYSVCAGDELFSVPPASFAELAEIEMKRAELEIKLASHRLQKKGNSDPSRSAAVKSVGFEDPAVPLLCDAGEYLSRIKRESSDI